jgi:hypothetical protein
LDAIRNNISSLETRIAVLNKKWVLKIFFYC